MQNQAQDDQREGQIGYIGSPHQHLLLIKTEGIYSVTVTKTLQGFYIIPDRTDYTLFCNSGFMLTVSFHDQIQYHMQLYFRVTRIIVFLNEVYTIKACIDPCRLLLCAHKMLLCFLPNDMSVHYNFCIFLQFETSVYLHVRRGNSFILNL